MGRVVAEAEEQQGVMADLDTEQANLARRRIPTLRHQRPSRSEAADDPL
jgi:hypothetical protein